MELFFDLDDTLVDTFHLLIDPLERTAADAIAALLAGSVSRNDLHRELMRLHASDPAAIGNYLRDLSASRAADVLAVHAAIFRDFDVAPLKIDSAVVRMLDVLRKAHTLVLLTEGHSYLQDRKICHLGIAPCFDFVVSRAARGVHRARAAVEPGRCQAEWASRCRYRSPWRAAAPSHAGQAWARPAALPSELRWLPRGPAVAGPYVLD
jgi:FMN phosphatase YigB (HAD superfamily)